MRKPRKSLKAVAITFLIGLLVPAVFRISGVNLINKMAWKGLLSGAFALSTSLVGILYSLKLIKGRSQGGKARIGAFLTIVLLLCSLTPMIALLISAATRIAQIIAGAIVAAIMTFVAYKIIGAIKNFFSSDDISKPDKCPQNQKKRDATIKQNSGVKPIPQTLIQQNHTISKKQLPSPHVVEKKEQPCLIRPSVARTTSKLKTILELWNEKGANEKYIIITNDENPDLKWVKIFKPRYGDGNFYGDIMMKHARGAINGKIYFANRPIWYVA